MTWRVIKHSDVFIIYRNTLGHFTFCIQQYKLQGEMKKKKKKDDDDDDVDDETSYLPSGNTWCPWPFPEGTCFLYRCLINGCFLFLLRLERWISNGVCPPPPPSAKLYTCEYFYTWELKYRYNSSFMNQVQDTYGALMLAKRCDPFKAMHASQKPLLIYLSRFIETKWRVAIDSKHRTSL